MKCFRLIASKRSPTEYCDFRGNWINKERKSGTIEIVLSTGAISRSAGLYKNVLKMQSFYLDSVGTHVTSKWNFRIQNSRKLSQSIITSVAALSQLYWSEHMHRGFCVSDEKSHMNRNWNPFANSKNIGIFSRNHRVKSKKRVKLFSWHELQAKIAQIHSREKRISLSPVSSCDSRRVSENSERRWNHTHNNSEQPSES